MTLTMVEMSACTWTGACLTVQKREPHGGNEASVQEALMGTTGLRGRPLGVHEGSRQGSRASLAGVRRPLSGMKFKNILSAEVNRSNI